MNFIHVILTNLKSFSTEVILQYFTVLFPQFITFVVFCRFTDIYKTNATLAKYDVDCLQTIINQAESDNQGKRTEATVTASNLYLDAAKLELCSYGGQRIYHA